MGAEKNVLASDHARQITTNDEAFLVIPAEAVVRHSSTRDRDHDEAQVEQENPENTSGNTNEENENSNQASEDQSTDVEETKAPEEDSESEPSSLSGVADSLSGTILVVDGQPMNIADAEVKGTPKEGASVKVEGYFADSGVFIVTKIEFLESDSNDRNETSTDNNNENDGDDDSNSEVDNNDSNDNNDTSGDENSNDNNSGSEDNGSDSSCVDRRAGWDARVAGGLLHDFAGRGPDVGNARRTAWPTHPLGWRSSCCNCGSFLNRRHHRRTKYAKGKKDTASIRRRRRF